MKKFTHGLAILAALLCISGRVYAQAPEQDCFNGIPVCQPVYTQANSFSGEGTVEELDGTNQDCLGSGEKNGVWYIINVTSPGILEFTITPNDMSDDYDFGLWDITGVGCDGIFNYTSGTTNPFLPVRCNYSGTPGATGCSNTITGGPWDVGLPVNTGQTLALYISNFEDLTQNGYTLDFSPSTASIYDTVKPHFAFATVTCSFVNDYIDVAMSEPVQCNTLAADGSDFSINLPTGYTIDSVVSASCNAGGSSTITYRIHFSGVLPAGTYTITAQPGSDGNTLQDNCGNFQDAGDAINFIMNPAIPPKIIKVDTPACISARLILDRAISCKTVAEDGSDFQVSGPSAVSVIKAKPISCNAGNMTDTIMIYFDKSIFIPGTYTINVVTGTDTNSISDTCGLSIVDPVTFVVSDQGGVIGTASPNVLCEPGYVQLDAQTLVAAPADTLECGPHQTALTGAGTPFAIGTGTTGTATYTPFYSYFHDARTQILYTAADLQAAGLASGTITDLAFNITQKNSIYPFNGFTIKIGCTSATGITSFLSGLTTVYGPVSYTSTTGVNSFALTTPFDWDGTSNLVVEVCFDNTQFSPFPGNDLVAYTASAPNSTFTRYQDGGTGCAMTSTTGSGGSTANRPNATFTVVPAPAGSYGFTWTPGDFVADTTQSNTTAFVPNTRIYQIQIMDTNRCYRRDTAQVIVSERAPTLTPDGDTAICFGDGIRLQAGGGVSYSWYPTTGLSCSSCPDPVAAPTVTTTYYAVITDQYGCSDTLTKTIIVNPLPVVDAGTDTTILFGESAQLYAAATGGMYYVWDPITALNNPNIPNPVANPQLTTTYTVLVIDTNQCRMTDSVRVIVDTDEPLFVPSGFSPNGDGRNDIFRVANLTFQKVQEFRVFNRWGQEVYNNPDNRKGWDGTFQGKKQDPGVYQYIIKVAHPDGRTQIFKGDVTLVL